MVGDRNRGADPPGDRHAAIAIWPGRRGDDPCRAGKKRSRDREKGIGMISILLAKRLRDSLLPVRPPSMLDWARQSITIPDGPRKGEMFDPDVQPFNRLFFGEVDSGRWDRIIALG